ncbi:hypothetical protein HDU86_002958 [Geranomyces michiganensis]|nr:hypothetical protein HDU86_002958 [Geranomyces michiganensis]
MSTHYKSSDHKSPVLRTKLNLLKNRSAGLKKVTATLTETHERAFEILNQELTKNLPDKLSANPDYAPTLDAILDAIAELENSVLNGNIDLNIKLESLAAQILDELKMQEDQVRIRATFRDFVAKLCDHICDDIFVKLGDEGLKQLGWEGVAWNLVKMKLETEKQRHNFEPGFRRKFTEMFEAVLTARGLTRNDFDMLMKFKKEAAQSFHDGELDVEAARKRLEEAFPPDLEDYKPFLAKGLNALG